MKSCSNIYFSDITKITHKMLSLLFIPYKYYLHSLNVDNENAVVITFNFDDAI